MITVIILKSNQDTSPTTPLTNHQPTAWLKRMKENHPEYVIQGKEFIFFGAGTGFLGGIPKFGMVGVIRLGCSGGLSIGSDTVDEDVIEGRSVVDVVGDSDTPSSWPVV